jgi:hypothetical protein
MLTCGRRWRGWRVDIHVDREGAREGERDRGKGVREKGREGGREGREGGEGRRECGEERARTRPKFVPFWGGEELINL